MGMAPQPILDRTAASVQTPDGKLPRPSGRGARESHWAGPACDPGAAAARPPPALAGTARRLLMTVDAVQLVALIPLLVIAGAGCLALLLDTVQKSTRACAVAGAARLSWRPWLAVAHQWTEPRSGQPIWAGMWIVDRMALFLDAILIVTALLTLLVAPPFMREHDFEHGELHALVLFATAGMVMVVHATHLLSLLIGIETMSLAAYALVASSRRSPPGPRARSSISSWARSPPGSFVYGIALVYGTTGGEMSYAGIAARAGRAAGQSALLRRRVLLLTGTAVQGRGRALSHVGADAYEAAPTPVTGFMAAGIKAAAVGGLLRLLGAAFANPQVALGHAGWVRVLGAGGVCTMTWGNLAALRQDNVKRMLAYSSIAHAGYLLIGLVALGQGVAGAQPALFLYLAAYAFTTLGVFRGRGLGWPRATTSACYVDDWAGLARARPAVALAMTVLLLSLAGVPPTGGFFGKFYLFRAAHAEPRSRLAGGGGRAQQPGERLLLSAHCSRDVLPRSGAAVAALPVSGHCACAGRDCGGGAGARLGTEAGG